MDSINDIMTMAVLLISALVMYFFVKEIIHDELAIRKYRKALKSMDDAAAAKPSLLNKTVGSGHSSSHNGPIH